MLVQNMNLVRMDHRFKQNVQYEILLYLPWNMKVVISYLKHSIQCAPWWLTWCTSALWSSNEIVMKRKNTSIVAFFTLCLSCWFCYMEYAQTIDMLTASGSSNNIICMQNDGTNKRIIKLLQNIHLILVACYGFTCLTVIICNSKLHAYVLLP